MKSPVHVIAFIAALAAIGVQPGFAQSDNPSKKKIIVNPDNVIKIPLKDFVPNNGCTFYENLNGGGESWRIKVGWKERDVYNYVYFKQVLNQLGEFWNDRISSVICESADNVACNAYLYEDVNMAGARMLTITEPNKITNLNQKNIGGSIQDAPWDKRISSIVVECVRVL